MPDIAGFWSYVHADDENDGGAIVRLADRVMDEYALLSGDSLKLFVDRDLEWGDEWKRRIDQALQETTFFIPIITPRYFKSEECRRELVKFRSASEEFGVEQLLLPIYYIEVPEMEVDDPTDQLMAYVKASQRVDLRKLRLKNESDAAYRMMVNGLASRLLKVATETETEPALLAPAADKKDSSSLVASDIWEPPMDPEDGESGGAGFLEVLAAGEEAIPKWSKTIEALSQQLEVIGSTTQDSTAQIEAENKSGNATFASRLATANRLAKRLEEPAANVTKLGEDYAEQLITIDPAVQMLIRLARENEKLRADENAKVAFEQIREMAQVSRQSMAQAVELANVMEESAGISRELRRPLRAIQAALRNISDGQEIVDDWDKQIEEILNDSD